MGSQWDFGECRDAFQHFFPLSHAAAPQITAPGNWEGQCFNQGVTTLRPLLPQQHLPLALSHGKKEYPWVNIWGFFIKILLYQVECYSNLGIGRHNETAKFTFKYLR